MIKGDKFFRIFQERENVDRLLDRLEEISIKGIEGKKDTQKEKGKQKNISTKKEKKGWRKYLPL
jgi:hypothetical protein